MPFARPKQMRCQTPPPSLTDTARQRVAEHIHTIAPGGTVGILGGGQLGRMLSMAAAQMGLHTHIFAPETNPPAAQVADHTTQAGYDDHDALSTFAQSVDVVTFEFENVPADTIETLSQYVATYPGARPLAIAQNRSKEKAFLNKTGIATAPYERVLSVEDLVAALKTIGTPSVLKTQTLGYDGKGQFKIDNPSQAAHAWSAIGERPAILEGFIPFDKEISVIAARGQDGATALYDVVENIHKNHILDQTKVPAGCDDVLLARAQEIATKALQALDYVGVLAVEMFACHIDQAGKAELLVNEIAPRVHNSGHWTLDAAKTSQFELHLRAVCGWPLGDVGRTHNAVMTNLLGSDVDQWQTLVAKPNTRLHLYGKAEARPGRKMGHVTELKSLS